MGSESSSVPPRWAVIAAFGLLVCGVLASCYGAYWVFTTARPEVSAALIAAMGALAVTVFSLIVTRQHERRTRHEEEMRLRKVPIYESLLKFLFRALLDDKLGLAKPSQEETMRFLAEFTQNSMTWASDEVIREFIAWRRMAISEPSESLKALFQIERVLLSIRKDLGHKNAGLKPGDLLSMFINDIPNR